MRMLRFKGWFSTIAFVCTILLFACLGNARYNGRPNGDDDDKKSSPRNNGRPDGDDRDNDHDKPSPTPPGLLITPTVLKDAVPQDLSPGFALPYFRANYPNFVAGEAVKAVVSPDGTTLAILTAGMNSLYFPNNDDLSNPNLGKVDTAASTQFLFLYDIAGANKTKPVLKQVIQQKNSHVGLVWAPNGQTLYAAGGCDDAVYAYSKNGSGSFVLSATINLGHAPNG
jgi:hypothetical protein